MTTKHTPGWSFDGFGVTAADGSGRRLLTLTKSLTHTPEGDKIGTLAAAAPTMFTEIETAAERIDEAYRNLAALGLAETNEILEALANTHESLRAAIAKATGE